MEPRSRWAAALLAAAVGCLAASAGATTITKRYAHTSTLLPSGNILIVGGINADPASMVSVAGSSLTLVNEQNGVVTNLAPTGPFVAVASHTATLMPNGEVLIAGGITGVPGGASGDYDKVQIYDPVQNCFRAPFQMTKAAGSGRYNHTATLMQNGDVLLCGGLDFNNATRADCDIFHPTMPPVGGTVNMLDNCGGTGGSMDATGVNMLIPREGHSATLLSDGRVFITGGLEPNAGAAGRSLQAYMTSSEVFTPGTFATTSAAPLNTGRAYHRASLMGNGKVLIVGGYDGGNPGSNIQANRGYLDTTEIYDPVADHMSPAATTPMRVSQQGQVTQGDGSVIYWGGLGNIPTTYISASGGLDLNDGASSLTGVFDSNMTMDVTAGDIFLPGGLTLGTAVTGKVTDGFILYSTPSVTFPGGIAYLQPGAESPTTGALTGTYAKLDGHFIGCLNGQCGVDLGSAAGNFYHITPNPGGQYYATPPPSVTGSITAMVNDGSNTQFHTSSIDWAPSPICLTSCAQSSADITTLNTELSGQITLSGLPLAFATHNIKTARLDMSAGNITINSGGATVYTISISQGTGVLDLSGAVPVTASGNASVGSITATIDITGVSGTVTASTPDPSTTQPPVTLNGVALTGVAGTLSFNADGVTLNDSADQFKVDVATVVIRQMVFSDEAKYTPNSNTWALTDHDTTGSTNVYGQTATLEPSASVRQIGGREGTLGPWGANVSIIEQLNAFQSVSGSMLSQRANETSTLLPNGKILLAGGTNGPNVLPTAELFDPNTQATKATGPMNVARDLHTATLLPNGRVLVAGGFATTATSTGSTNAAEIYYPNTNNWVLTSTMPFAADNQTATLLPDGNVLVAGGFADGIYLSSAAIYITTAATWGRLPDMNDGTGVKIARALHTASLLQDGRVLFAGGVNATGVLCDTVIFDPTKLNTGNPWYKGPLIKDTLVDSVCAPMQGHAATALKDGRILLTGGTDGVSETNDAYIFVPAPGGGSGNGTFINSSRLGNSINVKRFGHSAMLLPNGKVIIMGGTQRGGNALSAVETYDAAVSSFQSVGNMTKGRFNAAATLGQDGYIYVFGGSTGVDIDNSIERNYFTGFPDAVSLNAPPGARQPTVSSVNIMPYSGLSGGSLNFAGANLQGFGESSGGSAGSGNSSFNGPRVTLQAVSASGGSTSQNAGDFMLDLSTRLYTAVDANNWTTAKTTMTLQMPSAAVYNYSQGSFADPGLGGNMLPYGWYHLRDGVNSVYSNSLLLQVGPPLPTAAPTSVGVFPGSALIPGNLGVSSVTWSWSDPMTPGSIEGWEAFSSSTGFILAQTTASVMSFTQNNLAPNTPVSVAVAAYDISGDGPLGFSTTYYTYASSVSFTYTPTFVSTFTNIGFNTLTLNFDPDGNTQGTVYEISQSTDDFVTNVTTPVPTIVNDVSTSVVISFLQPNTNYWFRVRSFNGDLVPSTFSVVVTTRTRAGISGLTGSPAGTPFDPTTAIQWSWVDPGGVLYYKIYNSTVPLGAPGSLIGQSNTASFFDVGLATNNIRSVMVSAVTTAGEGPLSASATTFTLAAVPGPVTPGIVNLSTGSFSAFWTANGNPLFTQYQMVVTDASGLVITTVTTGNFSAGFGGFVSPSGGEQFNVEVEALNGAGAPSAFLVLGTTYTLPDNPSNLAITGTTPNSISVSWATNNNSSSATYEVQFTTAVDFTNLGAIRKAVAFSQKFNGNSITIPNLLTSTTYQIRVQASNPVGDLSAFTASITTSPFNGGAPLGSISGAILHLQPTVLTGSIGNGRAMTLTVPTGAFPEDTFVTVSTFDASGAGSKCPGGVNIGVQITPNPYIQPVHPVYLTLGYTAAELGAVPTSQAALNRVDDSGTCVPLQTTFDSASNTLTAQLNHFSQFQVANVAPTSTPDDTVVFPNPFMPSEGNGYVTFKGMPASARVRIFTLRGQLVFDGTANGSGLLTWGGTNRYGRPAASGVYLVTVEAGSDKKILKLVVLR